MCVHGPKSRGNSNSTLLVAEEDLRLPEPIQEALDAVGER